MSRKQQFKIPPSPIQCWIREENAPVPKDKQHFPTCPKHFCPLLSLLFVFQAYKSGMYGSSYVWILPGWYEKQWWGTRDADLDCTPEQIKEAAGHYIAVTEGTRSTDPGLTVSGEVSMPHPLGKQHPPHPPSPSPPSNADQSQGDPAGAKRGQH